jgi:hypothetical protein
MVLAMRALFLSAIWMATTAVTLLNPPPFKFRCHMRDASAIKSLIHGMQLRIGDDSILRRSRGEPTPNLELKCESRELSGLGEEGLPTMMN